MQGAQQTLSVEDYTRYFVKKIVKDEKYRDSTELYTAGITFYSLLQRFAREGDREDVRTPFKIMKDEFMNEWRASCRDTREELIRRLFGVLDIVHEECQNSVQNCVNGIDVAHTILEEFRLRIMKMVVGDTWKDALPLRIEALKHMHKYRNRELDGFYTQESRKHMLKHKTRHLAVKKLKRTVVGPPKTSWTAVFNDLLLSSGSKLAPLLFSILDENQAMEDHLLSIEQPKHTDILNQRGCVYSAKSGSSVSSSSVRPGSEPENYLPAADEEAPYYKSLNSDLNAKLQQFKQRGLMLATPKAREAMHERDDAYHHMHRSRYAEDDSVTSKSDDVGSRDLLPSSGSRDLLPSSGSRDLLPSSGSRDLLPSCGSRELPPSGGSRELPPSSNGSRDLPPSIGQRSLTPFMDEPPPPWCQPDIHSQFAGMQLSDELIQVVSPSKGMRVDPVTRRALPHSSSATALSRSVALSPERPRKSPSCQTATLAFSYNPHLSSNPQYRGHSQKPNPLHEYDLSQLCPFDNLDPLKASQLDAFK